MAVLYIKNVVCSRCIDAVGKVFEELDIKVYDISMGKVIIEDVIDEEKKAVLEANLLKIGFEILKDKNSQIIESIKLLLIDYIQNQDEVENVVLSNFLSDKLSLEYKYLSNLFSTTEGRTIEHYYISLRIEKVKELIIYDELTLSEIAFKMGFSSVAHLSSQFKRVTGMTPTQFKSLNDWNELKKIDTL